MSFKVLMVNFPRRPDWLNKGDLQTRLSRFTQPCSICTTATLLDKTPKFSHRNNDNNNSNSKRQIEQGSGKKVHAHSQWKRQRDKERANTFSAVTSSNKGHKPIDHPKSIPPNTTKTFHHLEDSRDNRQNNSTISACSKALSNLLERRNSLTSPVTWMDHETALKYFNYYSPPSKQVIQTVDIEARYKLYEDVLNLLHAIQLSKKTGRIRVLSGTDIQSLSTILGKCLVLCSETPPSNIINRSLPDVTLSKSTFDTAMEIIFTLREWNLNVQPEHYSAAIRAACHEGKFNEAASLFLYQIDPDHEGFIPVDSDLGWDKPIEMGLYAVAKSVVGNEANLDNGKEVAILAAEKVFDAVSKMCLVSSRDQEKCTY